MEADDSEGVSACAMTLLADSELGAVGEPELHAARPMLATASAMTAETPV
jgi:hypothetical protein